MILKHFPALQVILPLIGALLTIFTLQHARIARVVAIIFAASSFIISLYGFNIINNSSVSYSFGNWQPPIGIEYQINNLNQLFIVYINFVLLFFLIFSHRLIKETILKFILPKRQSLFYSVLLLTHSGYLGMISTNDLFNLYVFIEISALGAYVLMAQGNDPRACVGAFDYLILGSIGATLILISIGFLLSITGSLNMSDIALRLHSNHNSRIVTAATGFFLVGAILKTALFPMHFWMIRAYKGVAPVILSYLAGISGIIGIYIIFKFIHFALDYFIIREYLAEFIRFVSLSSIFICSYFAFKAKNITNIVIYSAANQIGYAFLLLINPSASGLLFIFLLIDSLNKIALFSLITYDKLHNSKTIAWRIIVTLLLICSSGLPISPMFIIKLNIFELLLKQNLWFDFLVVLLSSAISLLYHYKVMKFLFRQQDPESDVIYPKPIRYYGLWFILISQFFIYFINHYRFL